MNVAKITIGIMTLFILIHAGESEGHTLKVDPSRKKRWFYSRHCNWIPQIFSRKGYKIDHNCYVFPKRGCMIVGKSVMADSDTVVKLEKDLTRKLNLELGYSPGICWASNSLMGKDAPNPAARFYWLNLTEGMISYRLNHKYSIGISTGYLWTYLMDRYSHMRIQKEGYTYESDWEIWGIPFSIYAQISKSDAFNYKFQLNYYFVKGVDIEKKEIGFPNPIIKTFIANCWARGWGCSLGLNYKTVLFRQLKFILSPTFRIGIAKEYKNDVPEDATWDGPVIFSVTGMYLNFGLGYEF